VEPNVAWLAEVPIAEVSRLFWSFPSLSWGSEAWGWSPVRPCVPALTAMVITCHMLSLEPDENDCLHISSSCFQFCENFPACGVTFQWDSTPSELTLNREMLCVHNSWQTLFPAFKRHLLIPYQQDNWSPEIPELMQQQYDITMDTGSSSHTCLLMVTMWLPSCSSPIPRRGKWVRYKCLCQEMGLPQLFFFLFLSFYLFFELLGIELRAFFLLSRCSTTWVCFSDRILG
jgi:hypothetical protein